MQIILICVDGAVLRLIEDLRQGLSVQAGVLMIGSPFMSGLNARLRTLLGALILVSLSVALAPVAEAQDKKPFRVVTTFTIIQDIAQNVAGTSAIVESITKPGAEIHDYQPTPLDIVKAQSADLVIWNGMNLERWFEPFFQNVKNVPSIIATEGIEPMGINEGPYTGKPNPHAWMSSSNALIYVENIRKALTQYDPANAEAYAKNAAAYSAEIKAIDEPLRKRLSAIPEAKRWLVSSEGAFSYLARDYKLKELYLWPINADEQGTPKQVKRVIDIVRKERIPVVFSESTISDKPARQVAKETGASYGGVLYVDSLSAANGPVPSYLKLLEVTVQTIADGFTS
jgi:manganese/iron transport system substrate-binding protein